MCDTSKVLEEAYAFKEQLEIYWRNVGRWNLTEIGSSFKLMKFCSSWKIESETLKAVGNTSFCFSLT